MDKRYFCRNCKGNRNHKLIHEKRKKGDDADGYIQWLDYYLLIECLGCETISFVRTYADSEMKGYDEEGNIEYYDETTIFPHILKNGKELEYTGYLPPIISNIYRETLTSFKGKAYILTAGGFRAIIEATCIHLKIKKDNLSARIDSLQEKGLLTKSESKRLHSIRFLGNDALHEMKTPKKEHLLILLDIVNHLLENLFIQDKKIGDKIEIIIDEYKDFLKLLTNKITEELINKELSINEILGNSKRLIKNKVFFNRFIEELNKKIKNGEIDFLSIANEGKYKIKKAPNNIFNW
jgi:hypothetical protein